eukprot:GILI01005149.1.p1 GENE.GILI01005149.1~~GILI01005149.1.p1  ORF type:complete len:323 (-),score=74.88 GILI01005149.1:92-1024(-)
MTDATKHFYPVGTLGKAWGDAEKKEWLNLQTVKRSYADIVLSKIPSLKEKFEVESYGSLPIDKERYPLQVIKTRDWKADLPSVLVTGGVHGYETSGVVGALLFATETASQYEDKFNFVIFPCISPWAFETVNRWNPNAIDPNRHFIKNSPAEECAQAMAYIESLNKTFLVHFDLHETTDSDESEFSPAKASRDGGEYVPDVIPDGFYLVAPSEDPQPEWHAAMIESVRKVTHIAPPDSKGDIIGIPISQEGVVPINGRSIGLCAGLYDIKFATTTEVYPDSPKVNDENCNQAQVACIAGGLDWIIANYKQ